MEDFIRELKRELRSEVLIDEVSRAVYSVDASIYEIAPMVVVLPRSQEELAKAIAIASRWNVPIIPRGAATGICGGCLGRGMVVDCSRFLLEIEAIDWEKELVWVEAGVVQERLNEKLRKNGYRLGPDTSTGNRATIGGMVGTNAAGAHSLRYGSMVECVEALELVVSGGEVLRLGKMTPEEWHQALQKPGRFGTIVRDMEALRQELGDAIRTKMPAMRRKASGYMLEWLVQGEVPNLAKLIAGAEGSLGVVSRVQLRIAKAPQERRLVVIALSDLMDAFRYTPELLAFKPLALELIDKKIIEAGIQHPALAGKLSWLQGIPEGILVFECDGDESQSRANEVQQWASAKGAPNSAPSWEFSRQEEMDGVWELRKAGLGLLLSRRSWARAIAFIEDLAVPVSELEWVMAELIALFRSYGKEAGIYGHVGEGSMHIRPYIDLRSSEEQQTMQKLMEGAMRIVHKAGGVLSGEHGDGLLRSWTNEAMFGPDIMDAFRRVKNSFDPGGLMNPGKVIPTQGLQENLRVGPKTPTRPISTFFDWKAQGGFELSVDLCNGNGQCRKMEGVMCPSFHVTGDERQTTRARAQALRAIIHERLPLEDIESSELKEIMDLCIQCKGCKKECPSQVDMAKMKSELLYRWGKKEGWRVREKLFGHMGFWLHLASKLPRLAQKVAETRACRWFLEKLGICRERPLPPIAPVRFSRQSTRSETPQVLIFADCFTEFSTPEVGTSAVKVLQALGYSIAVLPWTCCGRTLISKGMLKSAKEKLSILLQKLLPYAQKGIPIVGLEPSCILTIRDELASFGFDPASVKAVQDATYTFDEFIAREEKLSTLFDACDDEILVHNHCHEKAIVGIAPTIQALEAVPNAHVRPLESGCCGMAGSFGYESEHYAISVAMANLKLLPAIRAHEQAVIIANGTSCRSQIQDLSGRRALHLAEFLARHLLNASI